MTEQSPLDELDQALSGKTIPNHILRRLELDPDPLESNIKATIDVYYVGLRDSKPMTAELCRALRTPLLNFCLPKSQLKDAKAAIAEHDDETKFVNLGYKARSLFIQAEQETKRSGEGGELLLFALLEAIGAPQIISKMYLKTASGMPVHGSDGLHLLYDKDKDKLTIFIGESKLYQNFSGGLNDALKSTQKLLDKPSKLQREIDLITDHIDTDYFSVDFRNALESFLDPYNINYKDSKQCFACLIGSDFDGYDDVSEMDPDEADQHLLESITKHCMKCAEHISTIVSSHPHSTINYVFFVIPFRSVQEFRDKFQEIVLEK